MNGIISRQEETIAAISTPPATGGIGIVRISGDKAFEIAQRIFRAKSGRKLAEMRPYTAAYGHVVTNENEEMVDEALALVFRAPKSYTGEDVVELSCHGGVHLIRKVLREAILAGARSAEPGEFTKRAYLNGKLDLTRAEAVMDLVSAGSDAALKAAESTHEGALFEQVKAIGASLMRIASDIAAWVDFPEEDVPELSPQHLKKSLLSIENSLDGYIKGYDRGRVVREGASAVLAGRPNTGKSTLMNLLSGEQRSIVSETPGTTRDVIEETVRLGELVLRLSDTAGLRETEGPVERIGVGLAKRRIEQADLVLAVFDASKPLQKEDILLLQDLQGRHAIAVLNKSDLATEIEAEEVKKYLPATVRICAKTGYGLDELQKLAEHALGMDIPFDTAMLANVRQLGCAKRARQAVAEAMKAVEAITLDAVSVCVDDALNALGELTGERAGEQVINQVFERFCVGK